MCPVPLQLAAPTSEEPVTLEWTQGSRVPGPAESGVAGGCGVELAEWNRVVARPTHPFQRQAAREPPNSKRPFLLTSLGQKLFPVSPGPPACRLVVGRRRWSQRLAGVPPPALGPRPAPLLQPRFPWRCPWCRGRLLKISSAATGPHVCALPRGLDTRGWFPDAGRGGGFPGWRWLSGPGCSLGDDC